MVKSLKPAVKKEKSSEKRKRRENAIKAREQARRFVYPLLVLIFALLAGFLFYRYGTGTKLSPEEVAKIRSQRKMAQMMREKGPDLSKLQELVEKMKAETAAATESSGSNSETFKVEEAEAEAVVE